MGVGEGGQERGAGEVGRKGDWRGGAGEGGGNLYCMVTVGISTVLFPPSWVQLKFQMYS